MKVPDRSLFYIATDLSQIEHTGKPETLVVPLSPFAFMCDDVNDLSSALNQALLQFFFCLKWLQWPLWESQSRESLQPEKLKPFRWCQTVCVSVLYRSPFFSFLGEILFTVQSGRRRVLQWFCKIWFLIQRRFIYSLLHAIRPGFFSQRLDWF